MYNILIRQLSIEDASISFRWRNNPEIWQYTANRPDKFITEEIEKNWLAEKLTEKNSSRFAIIVDDKYIGNIQITDIIEKEIGQYHIFIGEKSFWGKGIAKQATAQIIRFAKEKLNLKELYLIVNPNQISAIKLYEKCGFIKVNNEIRMSLHLKYSKPPVVSVFVMAYNHEQFIGQALEGILIQKTNFDFDIVVGEDCSIDNTRKIVLEYADKYPGKFKLLLNEHNIGAMANQIAVLQACTGKYIAICEGDDYWTDPYKLQKQVDFLEVNSDYGMVHSDCNFYYQNEDRLVRNHKKINEIKVYVGSIFEKLLLNNFIYTLTVLCKTDLIRQALNDINIAEKNWLMGDYPLWLEISNSTKIGYIDESLATYRIHGESISRIDSETNFAESVLEIRWWFAQRYCTNIDLIGKIESDLMKSKLKKAFVRRNFSEANAAIQKLKKNKSVAIRDWIYYFGSMNLVFNLSARILYRIRSIVARTDRPIIK